MKKLTIYEWIVLTLCAAFVLFCAGWLFVRSTIPSSGWQVYTERWDVSTADQSLSASATDGLLEGEIIDLNRASRSDLLRLPDIGAVRADAILAYRSEHGPFQTVDELLNVFGIGPATLEQLRAYISAE